MSQPCGGLSSAGGCQKVMFPQVTAFSNVRFCHGELAGAELYVPTLCHRALPPPRMGIQPGPGFS
jgi:hypothetical protein